jgi:hypothetical protein
MHGGGANNIGGATASTAEMKGDTEMMVVIGRSGQITFRPNNYVLDEGEVCAYRNDAVLEDGQSVRVPLALMDSNPEPDSCRGTVTQDAGDKPHTWNGRGLALHRPGFRSAAVLRDAADTGDIAALDAAKAINAGYDALHAQRADQAAEQKQHFTELQYPRR